VARAVGATSDQPAAASGVRYANPTGARFAILAAAVALAWPVAARGDGAVMVVGNVSPHDREVIVDTVRIEGTALSLRFTASGASRDVADASAACLKDRAPWSCVAPAIRGKDQLMIVDIDSDRSAGAPMTIVTAHLLSAGVEAASFASRNCAMCNEEALKRTVGELSRDLLQRAAVRSGRTKLAIHSRPAGAQITLDGAPIEFPGSIATYPGKHTVVLQLPGYAPRARDVVAIDGRTTELTVGLEALRPLADERRRPSQFLPGLAIGLGCAAIATGALLIYFDQDPDPRGPQRPDFYNTAAAGTVTLAVGALAVGAGAYFLLRPRTTSTAVIAPLPGGAAVGWAGRF
jgi:hypothetical protein